MSTRNEFNIALQFLTRLPVGGEVEHSDEAFARSARFYPAVGLLVGAIAAGVYFVSSIFFPSILSTVLALLTGVAATGALHEDGLADSFDGLIGGQDRDRTLEIMRDSSIGTYGILALIFAFALKLTAISEMWGWDAFWSIIIAHAVSRHAMVEVIGRYDYARSDSAKFSKPDVSGEDLTYARLWVIAALVASALLVGIWATLVGVAVMAVVVSGFAQTFVRKIGGYTGDCLGATQQIAEAAFLLGVVACL